MDNSAGGQLFYGHGLYGIYLNIFLAFIGFIFLAGIIAGQKLRSRVVMAVSSYLWLLFYPNAAYLFMEIKHLYLPDNIADSMEPQAVAAFAGMSILGLAASVLQVHIAVNQIDILRQYRHFARVILSILAAYGTGLGMLNLSSDQGLRTPLLILDTTLKLLKNANLVLVVIGLAIVLMIASHVVSLKWEGHKKDVSLP